MTYRCQFHLRVLPAHWRDFTVLVDKLNKALQDECLVPFQVWEAAFARLNEAQLVAEYDSLAAASHRQVTPDRRGGAAA